MAIWGKGLRRARSVSRVAELNDQIQREGLTGYLGIAHTRWATNGEPLVVNVHPHFASNEIALIHNGIIENYEEIRKELEEKGVQFTGQTDTEVLPYLVRGCYHGNLLQAIEKALNRVEGLTLSLFFQKMISTDW